MNTDAALRERAARVIPGGLWATRARRACRPAIRSSSRTPMAAGCGIPTGREYIDFMCSWGPVMRGHHDADVDAAAAAQARAGDAMNGPAPVLVDLAEFFTALVAHADWALFAKNGTDATTIGVTTARAARRKRKLLLARGACHGAARARGSASIFVTGSFWCGAVAMASALATLRKLQALDGITHMQAMGQRLHNGLDAQARAIASTSARVARRRSAHRTFQTLPRNPRRGSRGRPGSRANWPTRCTSTCWRSSGCGAG
jgi:glutamate-1-semialdehyde aminotransferase